MIGSGGKQISKKYGQPEGNSNITLKTKGSRREWTKYKKATKLLRVAKINFGSALAKTAKSIQKVIAGTWNQTGTIGSRVRIAASRDGWTHVKTAVKPKSQENV